jgi:hypothetical protein
VIEADSTITATIVLSVSRKASSAWCALGDEFNTATILLAKGTMVVREMFALARSLQSCPGRRREGAGSQAQKIPRANNQPNPYR